MLGVKFTNCIYSTYIGYMNEDPSYFLFCNYLVLSIFYYIWLVIPYCIWCIASINVYPAIKPLLCKSASSAKYVSWSAMTFTTSFLISFDKTSFSAFGILSMFRRHTLRQRFPNFFSDGPFLDRKKVCRSLNKNKINNVIKILHWYLLILKKVHFVQSEFFFTFRTWIYRSS